MFALLAAASLLSRAQPALDAVKPDAILADVRFLSDDLLEGRYSGSAGHALAERYVIARLSALGIQVSTQEVPLREAHSEGSTVALDGAPLTEFIVAPDLGASRDLEGPLQFAGYALPGDSLPDLRGKIAVVLASAPPTLPPLQRAIQSSNGEKLKRLSKAGAIAEIILSTPELEKRRPWAALKRNFAKGETFVADDPPPMPVVLLPLEASDRVRTAKRARLHLLQQVRPYVSHNVIGLLPGASPETIVYSAHLDHHGLCAPGAKDPICNGAIDNATGVGEMLAVAAGFAALPHRERTVAFVAVTAEELGLHGSAWFTRHPTLQHMIANLNLDQVLPAGPVHEIVLRGAELSTLEDHVREAAEAMRVAIGPDPVPEETFYARSDQINFARIGVPSACLWQGFGGDPKYEAAYRDFRKNRYHQPSDEILPGYDWNAAAQMARFELLVGVSLLSGPPPKWKPGSPFH